MPVVRHGMTNDQDEFRPMVSELNEKIAEILRVARSLRLPKYERYWDLVPGIPWERQARGCPALPGQSPDERNSFRSRKR